MNERTNNMSRRDWFRLGATKGDQTLGNEPGGSQSNLQDVEQPPNYAAMDLSELPPMREATLSPRQVSNLFADVQRYGSEVQLYQRLAGQTATASSERLESARLSLLDGSINKLQIRYRWNDSHWIDTLEKTSGGFRLIRIAHQF